MGNFRGKCCRNALASLASAKGGWRRGIFEANCTYSKISPLPVWVMSTVETREGGAHFQEDMVYGIWQLELKIYGYNKERCLCYTHTIHRFDCTSISFSEVAPFYTYSRKDAIIHML